jgi:DNA-binding FadR family transcriptional regulator
MSPCVEGRSAVKKIRHVALVLGPSLNRSQELTQKLTAEIRSGRLSPGAQLPTEQEMSAATGVSRTVVREAISALRAEGLVVTRQGPGAFVTTDVQRRPFRAAPAYLRRIQSEHLAIYEAVGQRNGTAARKAARRHLSNSLRRYQGMGSETSPSGE